MEENQEVYLSDLRDLARLGVVKEFPFSQIQIDENNLIYQGEYRKIYKSWIYGQPFAIKVLEDNTEIIQSLNGLKNHAILNHPNILILYGFCFHENKLYLVFPFQSKGTLENCITEINQIQDAQKRERVILDILIDIAKGIQFLHQKEIIHRDLKPSIILLDSNFNAKICDFDYSVKFGQNSDFIVISEGYYAPELRQNPPQQTEKNDIYSFGKIANFLFQNHLPDVYLIFEDCINENPDQRPSAKQILDNLSQIKRRRFGKVQIIAQQKDKKEQDTTNKLHNSIYDFIQITFILQFILVIIYIY